MDNSTFCVSLLETYYDGKYLWGSAQEFNGIYRIPLQESEPIECMGAFKEESPGEEFLYGNIVKYKNEMVFISLSNTSNYAIAVIGKDIQEQSYYIKNEMIQGGLRFSEYYVYQEKIVLVPNYVSEPILLFDLKTHKVVRQNVWGKSLAHMPGKDSQLGGGELYGKNYYAVFYNTNKILKMDAETFEAEIIEIGRKECKVSRIFKGNESLWLIDCDNRMLINWDFKAWEYVKVPDRMKSLFRGICHNEKIYLFPQMYPSVDLQIGVYDSRKKFFYFIRLSDEIRNSYIEGSFASVYGRIQIVENKMIVPVVGLNRMVVIDTDTDQVSYISCEIRNQELYKKIIQEKYKMKEILKEGMGLNIKNFLGALDYLLSKDEKCKLYQGEAIYEYIKGQVQ